MWVEVAMQKPTWIMKPSTCRDMAQQPGSHYHRFVQIVITSIIISSISIIIASIIITSTIQRRRRHVTRKQPSIRP